MCFLTIGNRINQDKFLKNTFNTDADVLKYHLYIYERIIRTAKLKYVAHEKKMLYFRRRRIRQLIDRQ